MSATTPSAGSILESGVWSNNTGLVQLLGLCPLLAVSNGAVNAIALGLATVIALTTTNLVISLLRPVIRDEVRIPAFVLVIASVVTAIELAMNAWLHPLYEVLGLFIPLIVTNCAVLGRAEAFASRHAPHRAALDGFAIGLGFLFVLAVIGALREVIGRGTLFAGASSLLGQWASSLETTVVADYRGFLIAVLPTGAFFVLAALIAAKNAIDARRLRILAR